jgi:serine/threonine protein kinase
LLVTESLAGGKEILDAEVRRGTVRDALSIVRRLWNAGIAHRDVKPSNLLVRDGNVYRRRMKFGPPWLELRPR